MTKKSKQILTDTVVIIDAHSNKYWNYLCNSYQLAIPAYILENEAFYFQSDRGKIGMNPTEWITQKKVIRIEAEFEDYEALRNKLNPDFMASIDEGEHEALAILMSKKHKDIRFTTADRAAIKALGVLGLGYRGVSVEELLMNSGVKRNGNSKLPQQFTKKWFEQIVAEGLSEQHLGLRSK